MGLGALNFWGGLSQGAAHGLERGLNLFMLQQQLQAKKEQSDLDRLFQMDKHEWDKKAWDQKLNIERAQALFRTADGIDKTAATLWGPENIATRRKMELEAANMRTRAQSLMFGGGAGGGVVGSLGGGLPGGGLGGGPGSGGGPGPGPGPSPGPSPGPGPKGGLPVTDPGDTRVSDFWNDASETIVDFIKSLKGKPAPKPTRKGVKAPEPPVSPIERFMKPGPKKVIPKENQVISAFFPEEGYQGRMKGVLEGLHDDPTIRALLGMPEAYESPTTDPHEIINQLRMSGVTVPPEMGSFFTKQEQGPLERAAEQSRNLTGASDIFGVLRAEREATDLSVYHKNIHTVKEFEGMVARVLPSKVQRVWRAQVKEVLSSSKKTPTDKDLLNVYRAVFDSLVRMVSPSDIAGFSLPDPKYDVVRELHRVGGG